MTQEEMLGIVRRAIRDAGSVSAEADAQAVVATLWPRLESERISNQVALKMARETTGGAAAQLERVAREQKIHTIEFQGADAPNGIIVYGRPVETVRVTYSDRPGYTVFLSLRSAIGAVAGETPSATMTAKGT
jgi:hypothetical protein